MTLPPFVGVINWQLPGRAMAWVIGSASAIVYAMEGRFGASPTQIMQSD